MPRYLDLDSWSRCEHFRFFRPFARPFFNLCAPLDVGGAAAYAGGEGRSFFLTVLHCALRAANETEPFRYRLRGDRVLIHDVVHAGSTVLRDDDSFGFGYFDWEPDLERFTAAGRERLAAVKRSRDLVPSEGRDDLIHTSVIPWVAFTSFEHARSADPDDSIPKIVFGKRHRADGGEKLPVSVSVHHALMDGLAVGRYFERLAGYLADPIA